MVDSLGKQLTERFEWLSGCNCDITAHCSRNGLRPGKVLLSGTHPSGLPRLARHSCIFESVYIIYPGMRRCQAERLSKWKVKPDDCCTLAFPALHSYR
ncbi:Triplex capsid protein 1, partial [Clarias magur]